MPSTGRGAQTQSDRGQGTRGPDNKMDLHALAEKVYELLKKEARIERERTGRRRP